MLTFLELCRMINYKGGIHLMETLDISIKNPIDKMNGYFEFDYKHPASKQRVRRKIEATSYQAAILKDLLEKAINMKLDLDSAITLIRTNNFYSPSSSYLEDKIQELYFKYFDTTSTHTALERDEAKNTLLDSHFPLSDYKANFCFLGKAGVGKSTIIKKMSYFWNNKEVSFPFTDTSRTSTFPADYCFVPKTTGFKFIATFSPESIIDLSICECMDRAMNKLLELMVNKSSDTEWIDEVMNSFTSDPAQSFDIRYSLGRYIKTTSPAYGKSFNVDLITFWNKLFNCFIAIAKSVTGTEYAQHDDVSFYQLKYSDSIKQADKNDPIYAEYRSAFDVIKEQILAVQTDLMLDLKVNDAIFNIEFDMSDEIVPYFSCNIKYMDGEAFYKFIRAFTTKKSSEFGHSVFNIVSHLRIELPLNDRIMLPQSGFSFVVQDTIGIAHDNDGNGGFENSTHLRMEDVDSVVLIDDSRMNGDNNMSVILSHLLARIAPYKIYFAFTFFDELSKADFDEDDDLDEQRILYLITTETNTIRSVVKDEGKSKILLGKLNAKNSFFMKKLMGDDFDSINQLIDLLIRQKMRLLNSYQLFKPKPTEPFVIYDYKKLPLLYQQAIEAYAKQQRNIYEVSPPHYKTTEALTNRLSRGITYFSGARTLRPVDDLYNLLIQALSEYIDNPVRINFTAVTDTDTEIFLGMLKTTITENLRKTLNDKFCSGDILNEWQKLYCLTGTGCDKVRRNGIISTENTIAQGLDVYLNSSVKEHIINSIEEAFVTSIQLIEKKLELNK